MPGEFLPWVSQYSKLFYSFTILVKIIIIIILSACSFLTKISFLFFFFFTIAAQRQKRNGNFIILGCTVPMLSGSRRFTYNWQEKTSVKLCE